MVGLDHDIFKKSVLIGYSITSIEIPNGAVSDDLDESTLFQGRAKSLLSIAQDQYVGIVIYETDENCSGKQYINDRYQFFLMKFDKGVIDMDLTYVPIVEPTQFFRQYLLLIL